MDRRFLEENLAVVEGHVAEGEVHLLHQRQLVSDLRRGGHDATQALGLLAAFEAAQASHFAHRDRLRLELSSFKP